MKNRSAVFIIDDNKIFTLSIKAEIEKIFEDKPYEVFLFEDGESAQSMIHLKPSLVLVDYHLDGKKENAKNGLDVIEEMKGQSADTDFIMIAADEHTELFLRSQKQNIYNYITKGPITPYKPGLSIDSWLKLKMS